MIMMKMMMTMEVTIIMVIEMKNMNPLRRSSSTSNLMTV